MKRIATGLVVLGLLLLCGAYTYDAVLGGGSAPGATEQAARHAELASWMGRAGLALAVLGVGMRIFEAGLRRLRGS